LDTPGDHLLFVGRFLFAGRKDYVLLAADLKCAYGLHREGCENADGAMPLGSRQFEAQRTALVARRHIGCQYCVTMQGIGFWISKTE
jgi:hypothetical protein